MGGRGGREFSFRRPCKLARERRVKRDQKLDEVFHHPSLPDISNFPWNEMKKWRANSHNKADNRAIKITFARPKKAKRSDKKKEGKKKRKNSETRISCPILPPPPFYGHLGARVEKFLLCGNHLLPAARERVTPLRLFFRRNAHTPLQTTHFPNTSRMHIYAQRVRGRERERGRRRRVDWCWSVLDWQRGSQATSQPASRLADQPTIPHSIRRFSLSLPGT